MHDPKEARFFTSRKALPPRDATEDSSSGCMCGLRAASEGHLRHILTQRRKHPLSVEPRAGCPALYISPALMNSTAAT